MCVQVSIQLEFGKRECECALNFNRIFDQLSPICIAEYMFKIRSGLKDLVSDGKNILKMQRQLQELYEHLSLSVGHSNNHLPGVVCMV